MDLVTLFQLVPPLLHDCIDDTTTHCHGRHILHVRALRLVNKECSGVALLGLKSYVLTLGGAVGPDRETNIGGVRLLRHARLGSLRVNLTLSGSQSPALSLANFVHEVGACLSTVTSLDLYYVDTGRSSFTAALLCDAIALLLQACPSLKSFSCHGILPEAVFKALGEWCPLLTALTMHNKEGADDIMHLQRILLLQPTLLPHITSLSLPGLERTLPDISQHTRILTLELERFRMKDDWLRLPRKLQHFKCDAIRICEMPPACSHSQELLSNLQDVDCGSIIMHLTALAKLLHAGPFPHQLRNTNFIIVDMVSPSTAANLAFVHQEMQMGVAKRFRYYFHFDVVLQEMSPTWIANLPCMTGVEQLKIYCQLGNLLPMLCAFPEAQGVTISHSDSLGNLELQALTACPQLQKLQLVGCNSVTAMGVLAVCRNLPQLARFEFSECAALDVAGVEMCAQLLKQYGSKVEVDGEYAVQDAAASESDDESDVESD